MTSLHEVASRLPPFPNPLLRPVFTWEQRVQNVLLMLSLLEHELGELGDGPHEATSKDWQKAYRGSRARS